MCHATKWIKCDDVQDDEYFESHYQFSQGLLHSRYDACFENVVETLLFSKCQKDPLSTGAEYKHRNILLTVDGEYCARCKSKTPLSLKMLSCYEILKHKEIAMVAVSLLPGKLIKFLMEVGLNIPKRVDWVVIKNSISVLLEYWPYKVLDLANFTDKGWFHGALTRLVLDRFAAEINSDVLQKPYRNQLTEFVMKTSVDSGMQSKSCFKLLRKFLPSVCDEKRRCVFEHAEPRIKYLTTGIHIYTEKDLRRILYMLRLSRKLGSSFEVRIINWRIGVVDISTLAKIFQEINPEIVKSFYMITKPEDILKLDKILKPCVELTSLSLELFPAEKNDALQQKLANDVSLLIGHHPTLKRLVLRNFRDVLVGYWDKYRLPTSVITLVLDDSILMHVDLEHGTDASIPSHIQDLMISNSLRSKSLSDIEGYLKFVESHAETLVSLDILLSNCEHQPTVDSLKRMAKRLAQFNKLQRFTYCVREVQDLLVILRDVMPLIAGIPSLNSYELSSDSDLHRYDRDFLQALQLAMKTICMGRKRPLDFATVTMDLDSAAEFEDGLPIVDYEDLLEVVGDQWHLPDFYDCEDDKEKDFQDDIPISEFEELCEVVPGA